MPGPLIFYVTGSTGFLGSHFVNTALKAGHWVVAFRRPSSEARLPLADHSRLYWVEASLREALAHPVPEPPHFPSVPQQEKILIHLAAVGLDTAAAQWQECFEVNVIESLVFWQRAVAAGLKKFYVGGSCLEYGRAAERYERVPVDAPLEPVGPYPSSKAASSIAAMALARQENLQLSVVRFFQIYGEGQNPRSFWPSLRRAALAGENFEMSPGTQVRDFMPAEEAARALLKVAESDKIPAGDPKVIHIGTGCGTTLADFAQEWWKRWGARGQLRVGARPHRVLEIQRCVADLSGNP